MQYSISSTDWDSRLRFKWIKSFSWTDIIALWCLLSSGLGSNNWNRTQRYFTSATQYPIYAGCCRCRTCSWLQALCWRRISGRIRTCRGKNLRMDMALPNYVPDKWAVFVVNNLVWNIFGPEFLAFMDLAMAQIPWLVQPYSNYLQGKSLL